MTINHTHITLVVDRSGSMGSIREAAQAGLREFIAGQRALPGILTLSLWQFDDFIDQIPHDENDYADYELRPRGGTALLDAIGLAVTQTGEALAALEEKNRPDKVIVYIVTDGLENSSKEWTRKQVFKAIEHQRAKYGWEFLFSAANQDAIAAGASIGIRRSDSLNFAATPEGMRSTYATASSLASSYRGQ